MKTTRLKLAIFWGICGILVGALIGGFTMTAIMGSALIKVSLSKPVCNLSGQIITK
jgi:hypothetical protein